MCATEVHDGVPCTRCGSENTHSIKGEDRFKCADCKKEFDAPPGELEGTDRDPLAERMRQTREVAQREREGDDEEHGDCPLCGQPINSWLETEEYNGEQVHAWCADDARNEEENDGEN